MKNAEETKGRVDLELKDLAKTLKNIEEARPFEDLTVVCVIMETVENRWAHRIVFRMMWLLLCHRLMREPPSWSKRDAGLYQATRYVYPLLRSNERRSRANNFTGEIRRSLHLVVDDTATFPMYPVLV